MADVSGRASETAELEVHLEVKGEESQVRAALNGRPLDSWEPVADGQFRAALRLPDQPAVDACVDRLRTAGVSIVALSRRRASLEDAFLKMLESEKPNVGHE